MPRFSEVLKLSMVSLPNISEISFRVVSYNRIGVIPIDRFELALRLQNNRSRYFTASDGGNQLIELWDLTDVGKLVQNKAHMNGQPPTVHIIGFVA